MTTPFKKLGASFDGLAIRGARGLRTAAVLALAAALLLSLAGCGSANSAKKDTGNATTSSLTVQTAVWANQLVAGDNKTITVGSDTTFPPFESVDKDGKTVIGFDVDIMTAMADTMGLKVNYKTYDWDGIIPGLNAGNDFDMICSALTITPERAKVIYFSSPYFVDSYGMAVPSNSTLADWKQLKAGDTVGVQLGSSGADWCKKNLPAGIKYFENKDTSALFQAMQGGEVKCIIQDYSTTSNFCATPVRQAKMAQRISGVGVDSYLGMGFQKSDKGSAMRDDFNKALQTIVDNGTYAKIYAKYFSGTPDFIPGSMTFDEALAKSTPGN
ncbi:MAG: transporter substrate-binding domain-containing protein [Coriobacteriia bacterium]|nr:transporter substrate-binding domain-containing protein [Coriobacteriia bacterium]